MTNKPKDWRTLVDWDPVVKRMPQPQRDAFPHHFGFHAHPGQEPPAGEWRTWLIMAGRGFGKTRAGAEWVRSVAEADRHARIALVAASLAEARAVMVEGESGLLACCAPGHAPSYEPSLRRLAFPNGAQAFLYSAAEPESLRGPQHSHAWCDEIGKWPNAHGRAARTWDNLLLGLRLGDEQRIVATTTPRAVPLIKRLLAGEYDGESVISRGRTIDNGQAVRSGTPACPQPRTMPCKPSTTCSIRLRSGAIRAPARNSRPRSR